MKAHDLAVGRTYEGRHRRSERWRRQAPDAGLRTVSGFEVLTKDDGWQPLEALPAVPLHLYSISTLFTRPDGTKGREDVQRFARWAQREVTCG